MGADKEEDGPLCYEGQRRYVCIISRTDTNFAPVINTCFCFIPVCACGNIYEQYAYEEKLEADSIDGQTVQTKMELDDPNTRISLSSGSGDNEKVTASLIENRDDSEESPVLLVVR